MSDLVDEYKSKFCECSERTLKLMQELVEARAEVERFRNAVREKERLELAALQELDEAQAEVERLRAELRGHGFSECDAQACNCGGWHTRQSVADRLRTVAERQREACAKRVEMISGFMFAVTVRDTPLVTEGDK